MHHFFLPPILFKQPVIAFPEETGRQIRSVLRLREGQRVVGLDNLGSQYLIELVQVSADGVRGEIVERGTSRGEPRTRLSLYLGLTQREKFEWMLQKCTEVGAAEFVPLITERSLVQNGSEVEKKRERWERILQEAAEQSGRGRIPLLKPAIKFSAAAQNAKRENHAVLIPWEGETSQGMREALAQTAKNAESIRIAMLIGPEGGFSDQEIAAARSQGITPVTLGTRIMRMETAAVVAAALALDAMGEMGSQGASVDL